MSEARGAELCVANCESGREEIWRAPPRAAENQHLVLEEEILSDHSPSAARPEALGYIGQKVDDEIQYRLHSREDQQNGGAGRKIVYWPVFGSELAIRDPQTRYITRERRPLAESVCLRER